MSIKFSLGFLIASLIQAGFVLFAENIGLSHLGAKLTVQQLITHILAGQVAGYILLFLYRKLAILRSLSAVIIGAIWGTIVWLIIIPLNAAQGKVKLPWEAGVETVITSLLAFILFGIIASYTIERYEYEILNKRNPE